MLSDEEKVKNLIRLHVSEGGQLAEQASFTCPRCGIQPMLFKGNRAWNNGQPVVECLCLAPFSPREEFKDIPIWTFPMTSNADAWGMFVVQKLDQPEPEQDEEEEVDEN